MANKTLRILGEEFEVGQPYAEGHVCTAAEAKSLNQTRAENIGNNLREAVREAQEKGTLDQFRAETFPTYDAEYTFATPGTGGTRVVRDPIEKEAYKIARELLTEKLKGETPPRKLKDVDPEKLEAAIESIVAREDIQKLAKKRVADKAKTTDAILAELAAP